MPSQAARSEARARYEIRRAAARRGWDTRHPERGGDFLEEHEIARAFPDIGLGGQVPDFLLCVDGAPAVVVEAKNAIHKIQAAVDEAEHYVNTINTAGRYRVRVAVGAAGSAEVGFAVRTRFLEWPTWRDLSSNGFPLTGFPARQEVEQALETADGTTVLALPAVEDFIDSAVEVSNVLRLAKVEAPLRPKVIGALILAMYQGDIWSTELDTLDAVNKLVRQAVLEAQDLPGAQKDLLIDALRLSGADFDRLTPHIRRVKSLLDRLNVRSVLRSDLDFLGVFYEAFLRYGYDNNALGIVFTPRHITRFCVDLLDIDYRDRVIDVAHGTGGFLVSAFDAMRRSAPSHEAIAKVKRSLAGFDTNPTVWALASLNMIFRGDGKSHLTLGSCFEPAGRLKVRQRFTKALLNPPFSQKKEPERDFIDASLAALEPGGTLAVVVKAGVFADGQHAAWREELTRKHSVRAVISLPEDLFYPTAAPTSILVVTAHAPQAADSRVLMARVWNDGYEKLKGRRVERDGEQLSEVLEAFRTVQAGAPTPSRLCVVVAGPRIRGGAEWSPQEWLPQPPVDVTEIESLEHNATRSVFRAVAALPDLSDVALDTFADAWEDLPELPYGTSGALHRYFEVAQARSVGEKHYAEGDTPYVSSGDATNSIVRLVSAVPDETIKTGAITVTAFGTAALQPWPFMGRGNGGSAVRVLLPRFSMSVRELLWFVCQINVQRWRFFYARMAIKSRVRRLAVSAPPGPLLDDDLRLAARIRMFRESLDQLATVAEPVDRRSAPSSSPTLRILAEIDTKPRVSTP